MGDYLKSTGRSGIASASEAFKAHLTADEGCQYDQVTFFFLQVNQSRDLWQKVVEIDLSTLEPHINGPFTPDLATPLSQFKSAATGDATLTSSPMDAFYLRRFFVLLRLLLPPLSRSTI